MPIDRSGQAPPRANPRFAGPLAAAWPGLDPPRLLDLLVPVGRSLPVPPATDREVWQASRVHPETLRDLRRRAEADRGRAWPVALASQYARYFRDGDRDTYEQIVFARARRVSRAAVLAAVTLDDRWLDEVADGVQLLCEQSSWCWPAHDDTRRVHGAVVPTVTDPFLDLGAGEVAGQLAWVDHLLGQQLDAHVPGLRARVRHEVDRRVLDPFLDRRDWHWLGLDGWVHNWNPWIHGNVLVAALRLVDEPLRRARLVALVVEGIDRYVAALPVDGAVDEGYSYWWNGACRAWEALDLLCHATGGALDAAEVPALRATVAFPHRMHLGGGWYVNHADGSAKPSANQPWDALHRAARRVGDDAAAAHAAAHRRPGEPLAHEDAGLGRLLRALTDKDWAATEPAAPPLPREVWLPSVQVLVARQRAGSADGLTLAVKGGHNNEHHNHNDVGGFVVALHGVPVLVDAGRPTYTAQTFSPRRYEIWSMTSSWHNTPEIRGTPQGAGRRFAARNVAVDLDEDHASLTLDLAGAYPRSDIRRWTRQARLERATGRVVVTDSWSLAPVGQSLVDTAAGEPGQPEIGPTWWVPPPDPAVAADGPSTVHLLVAGEVSVGPGWAGISAIEGAGHVLVTWTPSDAPVTATVRELADPMLSGVWGDRLTRLAIDISSLGQEGTLVLTMEERP